MIKNAVCLSGDVKRVKTIILHNAPACLNITTDNTLRGARWQSSTKDYRILFTKDSAKFTLKITKEL